MIYVYQQATGRSVEDCVFLGHRYDEATGDSTDMSDRSIWVNTTSPQGVESHFAWHVKSFLTGIWRSSSKTVYVSDATRNCVLRYSDVLDQARQPDELSLGNTLPEGVWGLSDDNFFAWGTRRRDVGTHEYPVFRWDGQQWQALPLPGYRVVAMHGVRPDLVYAVGRNGFVGLWNGSSWQRFPVPTAEILSSVFVAGPDEYYACGQNGTLLEGSAAGWGRIADNPVTGTPLYAVAKYGGELYVGAGPSGLMRRVGKTDQLEVIKDNIGATHLVAGEDGLIMTCDTVVAGTKDGQNFMGTAMGLYEQALVGQPILNWA